MKFVRLSWILLLGLWGCLTEPDCFDTSTNLVTFAFYDADDELVDVEMDSLTISGVEGFLIPEDNTFSTFSLPVNPAETEVIFTFYFDTEVETIALNYQSQTEVISEDCGALTYITDLNLLSSSYENITLLNNRLATNAGNNVKIILD